MKFAFIIDPIEKLDPTHDSSVALMESAQIMGHEVFITYANRLSVVDTRAHAVLEPVRLEPVELVEGHWQTKYSWYSIGDRAFMPLDEMDAVFMRVDPPVTVPYFYITYILDYIDPKKTLTINKPSGLRNANEKMSAVQFPEAIPETIVSSDNSEIRQFVDKKGLGVLKPLGGKAGEGIVLLQSKDPNFNSLIEISTDRGKIPVMIQEYIPEAKEGDKRIILLDGEPIGAVLRVPSGNEFRGNMAVGGQSVKTEITEQELKICASVAPKLREEGLYFVGIDTIGNKLTEINVTSPTGIREIDLFLRSDETRLGNIVIQWVEERVNAKSSS
ncbi:MAG: glutathione synthase [Oscillatoria sp. SIO1A7]|nr:glutathione synthase [Oscillatoria sp. SIO1A7]